MSSSSHSTPDINRRRRLNRLRSISGKNKKVDDGGGGGVQFSFPPSHAISTEEQEHTEEKQEHREEKQEHNEEEEKEEETHHHHHPHLGKTPPPAVPSDSSISGKNKKIGDGGGGGVQFSFPPSPAISTEEQEHTEEKQKHKEEKQEHNEEEETHHHHHPHPGKTPPPAVPSDSKNSNSQQAKRGNDRKNVISKNYDAAASISDDDLQIRSTSQKGKSSTTTSSGSGSKKNSKVVFDSERPNVEPESLFPSIDRYDSSSSTTQEHQRCVPIPQGIRDDELKKAAQNLVLLSSSSDAAAAGGDTRNEDQAISGRHSRLRNQHSLGISEETESDDELDEGTQTPSMLSLTGDATDGDTINFEEEGGNADEHNLVDHGLSMEKSIVPTLQDLCMKALAKNSEVIHSLNDVPDELKNKVTELLYGSKDMITRLLILLAEEPPEVPRGKDCSWMPEEQSISIFRKGNLQIRALQLDLFVPHLTPNVLARSPSFSALVAVSLKGAYSVTDTALSLLVGSAPSLRSINLSDCALLTCCTINSIGRRLGMMLKELYLDNCQWIDAMLVLTELKKMERLEVLSMAAVQTVCDAFVCDLFDECHPNMKELVLANCRELTDISLEIIAKSCPGLCALDLTNLRKLTDISLHHIAQSRCLLQKLKLDRCALSDEAIAEFLQVSGECLAELSFKKIKTVGFSTAYSLAKFCTRKLVSLDLSWCRKMTEDDVRRIVGNCSSLRLLKLFGCEQQQLRLVRIVGLKLTPISHLHILEPQKGPLRYSSSSETES